MVKIELDFYIKDTYSFNVTALPEINTDNWKLISVSGSGTYSNLVCTLIDDYNFTINCTETSDVDDVITLKFGFEDNNSLNYQETKDIQFEWVGTFKKPSLPFILNNTGSNDVTITFTHQGSSCPMLIDYLITTDGTGEYTSFGIATSSSYSQGIVIPAGEKLYLKTSEMTTWGANSSGIKNYISGITSDIQLEGDIYALLVGRDELTSYAFKNMFNSCTLTSFPDLYSTSLNTYCYAYMFNGCTINGEISLPATVMKSGCYLYMFNNGKLLSVPSLSHVTQLSSICFYSMFLNSNITTVPDDMLPSCNLASNCYASMFQSCSNLTKAPKLPSTTLASYCYYNMFNGCSSLTVTPELPAKTLVDNCYYYMFVDCTGLTTVSSIGATSFAIYCFNGMFAGCSSLVNVPVLNINPSCNYVCGYSSESRGMFYGCSSLKDASNITVHLNGYLQSYYGMFMGCSSLEVAPNFEGSKISYKECASMFKNCTSLKNHPQFSITSFGGSGYTCLNMFQGCTSLTSSMEIPDVSGSYAYYYMYLGCTSLTNAGDIKIKDTTDMKLNTCSCMFQDCTSLVTAPKIYDETPDSNEFYKMFFGCTKLNYIYAMFKDDPTSAIGSWVYGVSSTGTFVKNPNATWDITATSDNSYVGVPSGWTVVSATE